MNFLLNTGVSVSNETWSALIETVLSWCVNTGIRIIISLIILAISFRIINLLSRRIEKKLSSAEKHDKTMVKVVSYIVKVGAKVLVVTCLVGYLGIDTSGLTALVTSLGVCAGLAVNGALSNLAGGIIILFTRPFRIDDYIEVEDSVAGTVEDIQIVCTKLRTPDNKVIYVPNGTLSNSNIINYSEKPTRRVDFSFSISYDNDFEKAKELVMNVCKSHELVLTDPAPMVRVSEHGRSSVNLTARVWVDNSNYWTVKFDILEEVKKTFDQNGIIIPYNQLDVRVKQD